MKQLVLALALLSIPGQADPLDAARSLFGERKYEQARELLEGSLNDPGAKAERLLLLTRVCNILGDYEDGIRYGKQAVELLPDSGEAHFRYAQAMRVKMQKVSEFKAMFVVGGYKKTLQKAIDLDPKHVGAREEQIGFLIHAPGFAGGSYEKAEQRIAELKPLDWRRAMLSTADLESTRKNGTAVEKIYNEILEKYPDDGATRANLGYWYQRETRYAEADREFGRLVEHEEPAYAMIALYQRARTRILGEYQPEKAVEFLQKFIAEAADDLPDVPSKSNAYRRLGNAYEQLDDTGQAREAYRQALALDADNKEAKKALKALP